MCVHEISAAAIADAMSTIYELTDLEPASPLAVRLTNALYMETLITLERLGEEYDTNFPEGYDPEAN